LNDGCEDCAETDICGDGIVGDTEDCDDGARLPGDGCDADCQREIVAELEPNDTCATAQGPYIDGVLADGTEGSDFDEDWYLITLSADGDVTITMNDIEGDRCGCSDPTVTFFDADCNWLDYNDDDIGLCSGLYEAGQTAGNYYVMVSPCCGPCADAAYELEVTVAR
jgi:cysteine-rich repeat protein